MVSIDVEAEELGGAEAPAPRLHPGLAEVNRTRVAELSAALAADDGAELRERVRALVETIRLIRTHPAKATGSGCRRWAHDHRF